MDHGAPKPHIGVKITPEDDEICKGGVSSNVNFHTGRLKKKFAFLDHSRTNCCLTLKLVPLALRSIQNSR